MGTPWVRRTLRTIAAFGAACFATATMATASAGTAGEELFESKIRPILAEHCVRCHGPSKEMSGLRLDSRERALKGGELGAAVTPGKPEASLILEAVRHAGDSGLKMPPNKPKLPDNAANDLESWIRIGAPWPVAASASSAAGSIDEQARTHWAFQPIRKPEPPQVDDAKTEIDRFIRAKLRESGLTPAPPAERLVWLRRAAFDLIGLPPTPEEAQAFLNDPAPDDEVRARAVDRLLASPHYGERWGRHWLDVARYADTKGYVFQEERRYPYSYTYRDYVVKAFNDDLPYDRFLIEQIAADHLPKSDPSATATANASPNDNARLAAMGFLTVGRRFLNNNQDIIDDRIDVTTRGLMGLSVTCARCHDHKFDPIPSEDYYSLYGIFDSSQEPAELPELHPGQSGSSGESFAKEVAKAEAKANSEIDAIRRAKETELRSKPGAYLLAAFDSGFPGPRRPGFGGAGNRETTVEDLADQRKLLPELVRWSGPKWKAKTSDRNDPILAGALAGKTPEEWAQPAKETHPLIAKAVRDNPPKSQREAFERCAAVLDSVAKQAKEANGPLADPDAESLRRWIETTLTIANVEEAINRADRNKVRDLRKKVEAVKASHPDAPPRAMVMTDKPDPHDSPILIRGNPGRPGAIAPRRFLKAVATGERKPFRQGSGRLELAQAIASKENPLTARVWVNRVWQHHFGQGLVSSPSDFGMRSDPPSHPELLDWLAATFMEEGWSTKALHRRILLSQTYRQSSIHPQESQCAQRDSTNRLLWRSARRRLEFEAMRDAMLAVAGHLDRSIGGKSVSLTSEPFPTRRTIYGFIDRQNLEGIYRVFDFADPNLSNPQRHRTTVPQQALFLLNSPFSMEQARRAAESLTQDAPADRVRTLYWRFFSRPATDAEIAMGVEFVQSCSTTEASSPWMRYAHALLMSNEFLFVD